MDESLSGGEPLIHHRTLPHLLDPGWEWHVETNGTIAPPVWWPALVRHTTVSPKVITTADPEKRRLKPRALEAWAALADEGHASFKFVVSTPADLKLVAQLVDDVGIPHDAVWVMPEGQIPDVLLDRHRLLADAILERRWHTTTRLHALLWGTERGH
jgi:organic radical activating enzyme